MGAATENLTINIVNTLGQVIKTYTSNENQKMNVVIEGDSGIYFVEISNEKGLTRNFKLILNK